MHYGILLIILLYIGLYVFWWDGGYFESQVQDGAVALKIKGQTYSINPDGTPMVWSAEDLIWPAIEPGAAFISTSIIQTNNQSRGTCGNPLRNCTKNSDCPKDVLQTGVCSDGFCQAIQWCPAENITVDDKAQGHSVGYEMEDAGSLTIWMKATMSFPALSRTVNYSTVEQADPVTSGPDKNLYSLNDLLNMTGTAQSNIRERGAILLVILRWKCFISSTFCFPKVEAHRLDLPEGAGFNMRTVSYSRDIVTGTLTRDLYKYMGVRIFFVSRGIGYAVSVSAIVLQLSSALALTAIATAVTDFALQYIMPERKRYKEYKILEACIM